MWDVLDDVLSNIGLGRCRRHIEGRRFRAYIDNSRLTADRHRQIDRWEVTNLDNQAFALDCRKTLRRYSDDIGARGKVREPVVPLAITLSHLATRQGRAGNRYRRVWKDSAGSVPDCALQTTGGLLRVGDRCCKG